MSRAPNHEFQEWWNKQRERGLDPSSPGGGPLLPVEIRTPLSGQAVEKSCARSARQLSWVCLLRFQQIASLVASAAGSLVSILRTANRRIGASPADSSSSRLFRIIRFFLILVLVLLGFELLAYSKGWHFSPPLVGSKEVLGFVALVYANWLEIRFKYLAPPLQSLTDVCIVLFLIQSVYRAVLVLGCLWTKIKDIKPVASVDCEKKGDLDIESGDEVYPMVLVQIPMRNEKEVDEANENSDAKRCKHNGSVGNENCSGKAEHDPKGSTGTASEDKQTKAEVKDYIHVRARRGQATDSHSLAERLRREKISERMKILQDLVPGCNKVTGKALMLDEIINYVQSLQRLVEFLSMKLASVNTSPDYKVDALMSKEVDEANENSGAKRCKHNESVENENCSVKAEHDPKESTGTASEDKQTKAEVKDYIHVRARRGQATDSHSLAERVRREKISERMKILQDLVPGCNKVTGKALMLDEIINYVQMLQRHVEFLSMKLASVNSSPDYKVDTLISKEMFQSNDAIQYPILPPDSSAASVLFGHRQHQKNPAVHNSITEGTTAQMVTIRTLNDPQFPPLDGSNDHVLESFCGDDLQMLVQMGFGQDALTEAALDHQDYHGQNQVSHMKIEL